MNKNFIQQYIDGQIGREELRNSVPNGFSFEDKLDLLLTCKVENRPDHFETVFWVLPPYDYKSHLILSRWALLENCHFQHEEIISSFQTRFNSESINIHFISSAIHQVPQYLQNEVLRDSYIRKGFYAIAAQPKSDAVDELKKLKESEDEIFVKYAEHQLSKLVMI